MWKFIYKFKFTQTLQAKITQNFDFYENFLLKIGIAKSRWGLEFAK